MARKTTQQLSYTALRIEGGLIPAEELNRLTTLATPEATEQTDAHYGIPKGLKLRDEIARSFKIAQSLWQDFVQQRERKDVNLHTVTVQTLMLPMLRQVLGFTDLNATDGLSRQAASQNTYNIGHIALGERLPLVLAACDHPLDFASERFGETNPETGRTRRRSPYMLAQEALNASEQALWAIVSNGHKLRILRDNPSLTRPAYVEVDLEAIFTEELYADFTAFWLLAHTSRFGKRLPDGAYTEPTDCPWERWRNAGQKNGETVRMNLRFQVEHALRSLGTGFLSHQANTSLREQLQDPERSSATKQAFFEELLSLVYRFIFLATVEDRSEPSTNRSLIFTPDASEEVQQRYWQGYSLTWLRDRAVRRSSHDTHSDLWQALSITFNGLATGQPALGLPALGGLFAKEQCPLLNQCQIDNRHLLAAVFQLGYFRQSTGLTRVNYRDMGAEELGSVYESLLELVPDYQHLSQPHVARLAFVGDDADASNKGNTRKITGSYYTPDSLVQELIKSALEPVIAQTIQANPSNPVNALLELTVCDPACGSGHFLLAAARRLADEVAKLRAAAVGGAPTPADYRHALRDVVSHCIYGVDKNPMAIALAKTALWLEAYTPDRPLTFIDHHLQVGDALLGVLDPKILENGIPDEAYAVLSGDDKATAAALKKQNKAELKSWKEVVANDLFAATSLVQNAHTVERLADDTLDSIAAKRSAWVDARKQAGQSTLAKLADTYVAAFLAPKVPQGQHLIPLSGYLWGLLHPNPSQPVNPALNQAAYELCRAHSVFHWWLAFPQVAAKGGFAVMLGNPPWEMLQLDPQEFFAAEAPSIANAQHMAARNKMIAALETERPYLFKRYWSAVRAMEAVQAFVHASGRFPTSGFGRINLASLFAETVLQATALDAGGRAGLVLPSGIATDSFTQHLFNEIARRGLVSLFDFENREAIFSGVHRSYKFSLMTFGKTQETKFQFFAGNPSHLADAKRQFTLTPEDFELLNPNTHTCPVFRSNADAELTKKLYRSTPVLWREAEIDSDGNLIRPEVNSWNIQFQLMFMMNTDSHLFADSPAEAHASAPAPRRLPLYEAKMVHQFDHRWATYVDNPDKPNGLDTEDVSPDQKADPSFTVRPRYWVDEREVLARIARVPSRVANAWLAWQQAADAAQHNGSSSAAATALQERHTALTLALASWVAGALFRTEAERLHATHPAPSPAPATGSLFAEYEPNRPLAPAQQAQAAINKGVEADAARWSNTTVLRATEATERLLASHHPLLAEALKADGTSGKKALPLFQKWALQDDPRQGLGLSSDELAHLQALQTPGTPHLTLDWLNAWIDRRSPRWLMGWRDITNATNERTVIASVVPRVGVGHTMPLFYTMQPAHKVAAMLGNWSSLTLDYLARQKVGGTHLTYGYLKQFPVLPPDRYTPADLAYIVPRVLELTHTAHDMQAWADDLLAAMPDADPRPFEQRSTPLPPFPWNPERRAQLRAELDAYYARLYGLTRDELRYILDPADVMGEDYPSETFRVLKNNEMREFGEYRTQRLVLETWDQLDNLSSGTPPLEVTYSSQGMIRSAEEGALAGLVIAVVAEGIEAVSLAAIQSLLAGLPIAPHYLGSVDGPRFDALRGSLGITDVVPLLSRILPIIQRLEAIGVLVRSTQHGEQVFARGSAPPPREVIARPEHTETARLLWLAEERRNALTVEQFVTAHDGSKATGTQ